MKYNLYNEDCIEVMRNMPEGSIDLVCTDPPYLIPKTTGGGTCNKVSHLSKALDNLKPLGIHKGYNIDLMAQEIDRIQGGNINAYFFCNKEQLYEYLTVYVGKHRCRYDILLWHKTNAMPTYSNKYLSDKEYILYFRKGKGRTFPQCYDDARTVFTSPLNTVEQKRYSFPTVKPLHIVETLIRNSSRPGEVVFDPFTGSGTTAVAALNLGRRFTGCEIDRNTYRNALIRIYNEVNYESTGDKGNKGEDRPASGESEEAGVAAPEHQARVCQGA